ncbi:large conductance mechanosensitive channel protein MscL [Curtanaerobium respiraculi]|uniref:large conductance mechanosensitive channel protein MscL n=1 Tax=Curtanaerobium respiraculi TaxID=2949669 RepID=UPI0024B3C8E3|nr:large conductance mechanosensitive channel protein MscL [Curtanaerobium respiraculi]
MASKFISEFKEFVSRGNVMDMAVGIIIGGAFTAIVTSLTTNIINPLITLATGGHGTEVGGLAIKVSDSATIDFGAFISAILNFLIIAFVVFCLVKAVNSLKNAVVQEKEEEATTKTCPFCKEEIAIEATRCPHCTSELD